MKRPYEFFSVNKRGLEKLKPCFSVSSTFSVLTKVFIHIRKKSDSYYEPATLTRAFT